jgi:hypothetical protein
VSSADRTPLKDRGWSWSSVVAQAFVVGVSLAAMTYYAWADARGSMIFGLVMGVGWLATFSVLKHVRERGESPDAGDATRWLRAHWQGVTLVALLSFDFLFTAVSLLVGDVAAALVGLVLAVPALTIFGVRIARQRS